MSMRGRVLRFIGGGALAVSVLAALYVFWMPMSWRYYEDSVLGGCICTGGALFYHNGKLHYFNPVHRTYNGVVHCREEDGNLLVHGMLIHEDGKDKEDIIEVRWDGLYVPGSGFDDDCLAKRRWLPWWDGLKEMLTWKRYSAFYESGVAESDH